VTLSLRTAKGPARALRWVRLTPSDCRVQRQGDFVRSLCHTARRDTSQRAEKPANSSYRQPIMGEPQT